MITISLCMIIKDEEKTLARCLECIKNLVDEIIIIDTGSVDSSKEIAKKYTLKVYDYEWHDDFAAARNFSFSKASKEYVMWLDADDILLKEDQAKLLKLKEMLPPTIDAVYMKYNVGEGSTNEQECTFWRERLVKKEKNFKWFEPVHEYLLCSGEIVRMDIAITHMKLENSGTRNLDIFERYIASGNKLSARQYFYYARELFNNRDIDKAIQYYNLFLEKEDGLRSNYLYACIELSSCYDFKKDDINSLKALIRYFERDIPRAEICCKIGAYYRVRGNYEKAIEWYKLAPYTTKLVESIGAIMPQYWDYIPYMELCACYYKLGNLDQAIYYNEKVAESRPNDKKMLSNRCFLAKERLKLVKE